MPVHLLYVDPTAADWTPTVENFVDHYVAGPLLSRPFTLVIKPCDDESSFWRDTTLYYKGDDHQDASAEVEEACAQIQEALSKMKNSIFVFMDVINDIQTLQSAPFAQIVDYHHSVDCDDYGDIIIVTTNPLLKF